MIYTINMKNYIVLLVIASLIGIVSVSVYTYKSGISSSEKFQWVQHWNEIDIAAVKRNHQPYTVAEMSEMWNDKLIAKYGGAEKLKQAIGEAYAVYPQDTFLARLLKLGRPFIDFSDYEDALTKQRCWVYSTRVYWESMNAVERTKYLERRRLPLDTKWDMYEETLLKNIVVYSINFRRAIEQDPYMNGTLQNGFNSPPKSCTD